MKNSRLTLNVLLKIVFILSAFQGIKAQNNKDEVLYNWFDHQLGGENLAVNNGTLHLNYDRTVDNEHRYFNSNKFSKGQVTYDGQTYSDVNLKYDILKDVLVLNPTGENENLGVELIKENVADFKINGRKFINFNLKKILPVDYSEGYYEEAINGNKFIFYIKHNKKSIQIIRNEFALMSYDIRDEFVVYSKNTFTKINSKRDIIKLFPNYKDKINDFYLMNKKVAKEDKAQFMENLMKHINQLLPNESN
ncbi:hypothetical protein [Flavobacterium sp.]|uniref:hypothetical protein n=1 Tax=Flavobacterium sp. TaxID=239 RepID=UPI00260F5C89|nr:hypothetical protein [Flavobacterium sp.]